MNDQFTAKSVLKQLEHALTSGGIRANAIKQGKLLLKRLNSPVRVVILGMPGSGKSQLLNFLSGQTIIPNNCDLPSLELSLGECTRTIVMREDETSQTHEGLVLEKGADPETSFVRVEMPSEILEQITLLEVVADDSFDNQSQAIGWALERADIVLWCSQEFNERERTLWAGVPDGLKDHSFLVLTKADILSSQDILGSRIMELQDIVADEFHSMIPVATKQAIAATGPEGTVDQSVLLASGGNALMKTVMRQVDSGRQADMDSVMLFLNRHGIQLSTATEWDDQALLEDPEDVVETADQNAESEGPNDSLKDLYSKALGYLHERSEDMVQLLSGELTEKTEEILENCTDTANNLTEILTPDFSNDTEFANLQEDFMAAADTMILMQMEDGEAAAADAVTLLLQMKKDLQEKLAA